MTDRLQATTVIKIQKARRESFNRCQPATPMATHKTGTAKNFNVLNRKKNREFGFML